jgi:hypothetical protein
MTSVGNDQVDHSSQTNHWTEVVGQFMEKLTGKNMTMTYEFDDLTIDIPSARGPGGRDLGRVQWKINGKVTTTTETYQKGSTSKI